MNSTNPLTGSHALVDYIYKKPECISKTFNSATGSTPVYFVELPNKQKYKIILSEEQSCSKLIPSMPSSVEIIEFESDSKFLENSARSIRTFLGQQPKYCSEVVLTALKSITSEPASVFLTIRPDAACQHDATEITLCQAETCDAFITWHQDLDQNDGAVFNPMALT